MVVVDNISQIFGGALAALNDREMARAENLLRQVVEADPSHVPALNLLVVALMSMERFSEAESFIARVTALNQNSDVSFYNFGVISKRLNKPQQALENFDKALNLNPRVAETWNNRGTIFNDLKQYELAVADFDQAISLNGLYAEAYANKGNSLTLLMRCDEALAAYDKALSIKPDLESAWLGRGNVFTDLKRYDEAFAAYAKALSIKSDLEKAWIGRGNIFAELRRYDEALAAYDKALSIKPDLDNAWLGRGNVYAYLGRYGEALEAYDKALSIKPDLAQAWLGCGYVLRRLKRYDDALTAYDKALSIKPDLSEAWIGRGNVFFNRNRDTEASECYERSIALRPESASGYYNKAMLKLSLGEFEEGWKLYEWRWKYPSFSSQNRNFRQPLWINDFDIGNKTILIHAEQGFGDTINFSRYLKLLNQNSCRILFETQRVLAPLFKSQNWQCEIIARGDSIPSFDAHCPLMSLPLAFKTMINTIPADIPYIACGDEKQLEWSKRIGAKMKPRIGLAWSGNPNFAAGLDTSRPIPLSVLSSIMTDEFEWYRLQTDLLERDRETLSALSSLREFSHLLEDFSDTAALIQHLDLIISIDTSVAHLAGAMGKPVWIMLPFHPDFRWLRERMDSPWYPTARLYRQTKDGDWANVLNLVSEDLKKLWGH